MPDMRTRLGQYCTICQYTHKEEYLVCDWIYLKDRYYNYGFCKRSYHACGEYDDTTLFGPFRIVEIGTMWQQILLLLRRLLSLEGLIV